MLFKPLLVARIRDGSKTTTRRRTTNRKRPIVAGSEHALQPGRGKKHVGHLRVTAVKWQQLSIMGNDDARREGFATLAVFRAYWRGLHREFDPSEIVTVIDFKYLGERDCCAPFVVEG